MKMIKIPFEPYWATVKETFMSRRNEWLMESEDFSKDMALWLAQHHGCIIRGRKHLFFEFSNEYDAEMFVLRFSGKD